MTVEFISATFVNDRTEIAPRGSQRPGSPTIDRAFLLRYARELDAAGCPTTSATRVGVGSSRPHGVGGSLPAPPPLLHHDRRHHAVGEQSAL